MVSMKAKVVHYFSDWSELCSDYAAFLQGSLTSYEEDAEKLAKHFIDAGILFAEFEALHAETVKELGTDPVTRQRTNLARRHIHSAYDRAFLDLQSLARRHRSEVVDRDTAVERIPKAAPAWATNRSSSRKEVSIQHRILQERSVELEVLNKKLAAQRDEMAGFLYSASHDLKSPLNTVKGLLEFFLEEHRACSIDCSDIEAALATTTRTDEMLGSLLSFSQSLDAKPEKERVDLSELIGEIIDDLGGDAADQSAEFVKEHLPTVLGSSFQLRLLFQNLISNGVKYCATDKTPRVEVKDMGPRGVGYTAIAIVDNGIGIDPAYHRNIFGLFNRLHVQSEYPGAGIGLALCQRIVSNHKGQIHLRSALGEGTKFTIVLPM